ncbi:hypothetical protein [Virgibacillus dakarensis]|uniref:hypothetical protein n=1 Tax=Virgibacillus dakarensis TaxID=1917889 RepID=UPI000B4522E5|nr:hypothetical protein [Virgibacillus dakarensis]
MDNDKTNTKPSEMNPEDLPDVRAFHDEFTRGFLQSMEETRPGYYPFLSGTGAYKMDFPAGGIVGEKGYGRIKKKKEGYLVGIENENGTGSSITINYDSFKIKDHVESYLDNLKDRLGKEVEFKKLEIEDDQQSLYYAYFERNGFYTYAGYLQNEKNHGGIQAVYQIDCGGRQEEVCKENKKAVKDRIIEWMKSIQFINGDEEVSG